MSSCACGAGLAAGARGAGGRCVGCALDAHATVLRRLARLQTQAYQRTMPDDGLDAGGLALSTTPVAMFTEAEQQRARGRTVLIQLTGGVEGDAAVIMCGGRPQSGTDGLIIFRNAPPEEWRVPYGRRPTVRSTSGTPTLTVTWNAHDEVIGPEEF